MTNRKPGAGLSSGVAVAALMLAAIVAQPVWAELQEGGASPAFQEVSPALAAASVGTDYSSVSDPLDPALAEWDRLRRDTTPLVFTDLSRFLAAHRAWPGEMALRKRTERAITASTPVTTNGIDQP